jgi:3-oxoacyl-[acyl-carrier protein] reductase
VAFLGSPLAVLVNNVGNYVHKPLLETTDAEWADMLGSNLTATFATCQAAAPLMQAAGSGRIVNLGYAGAKHLIARPGIVPYVIAKAGVLHLSHALGKVLAGSGVSVNVVSPGVIETSVSQPLREIPAGRVGTVEELLSAVLYFVRASDYVTGQELEVAGGWNL